MSGSVAHTVDGGSARSTLENWCRWGFTRVAAKPENYHRRAPQAAELDRIFRLESERIISQDWVVRYDNRFFQLQKQSHNYAPAQSKVLVCEGRHGRITIEYRGEALRWQEIPALARPPILSVPRERVVAESIKRKWTPPVNHPWRKAARRGLEKRERLTSRGTARGPQPSLVLPSVSPSALRPSGFAGLHSKARPTSYTQHKPKLKKGTFLMR